jgi:sugar/nucleoside kinase (ribokinase family)
MEHMKTILGTGIFNLDIISVREYPQGYQHNRIFTENLVKEEAGGTCGNIMCMLAYMGWQTYPLTKLDNSEEGLKMTESLKGFGCDCRFVTNTEDGGTTILTIKHGLDEDGNKMTRVMHGSPGGSRFPRRRFLRLRDQAPKFLEKLDFVPDVFFFDDPAAGHRYLAKELKAKGSLVYFEPERIPEKPMLKSVEVSDVVKFSVENVQDVSFTDGFKDKLFIQTLGAEGLRFNLKGQGWVNLPPVENDNVADWDGAGDWTTSAFLDALSKADALSIEKMTVEIVKDALEKAQAVASKSVSYIGSKGMIQ